MGKKGTAMKDLCVLLIGSGGREHALAHAIASSSKCRQLYIAPGNGGTHELGININLDISDHQSVVSFVIEHEIDLVVVGPEAPLVAGLADDLRAAGIKVFGAGKHGAQLEGSKSFAKDFMRRHGLPTARYQSFSSPAEAHAYILSQHGAPLVVKADGLAAGKGVLVCSSAQEAHEAVEQCLGGAFGAAGSTIVIEECMTGPECSLLILTDGINVYPLDLAQDHKRVGEGDTGLNTGGMGVYSPVNTVSPEDHQSMLETMHRAVEGMRADGMDDFRGVLYGGFMLTEQGPKLLEFNVRFGDPETQVLLPRISSDVLELLYAVAGQEQIEQPTWHPHAAVSVVMCSAGYPGSYRTGVPIAGIDQAELIDGVRVYHAGTALNSEGRLVTAGGRVLNVTAVGEGFMQARDKAYQAVDLISFEGAFYRRDIGAKQLAAETSDK